MRIGLHHGKVSLGLCALFGLLTSSLFAPSCSDNDATSATTTGGGPVLSPGEVCFTPPPQHVRIRVEPSSVVVPPCPGGLADPTCVGRMVKVVVDPDFCVRTPVSFLSQDQEIAPADTSSYVELDLPTIPVQIFGGTKTGSTMIQVSVPRGDGTDASTMLKVEVAEPKPLTCSGAPVTGTLAGGQSLRGKDGLTGASISLPEGAGAPNSNSFLWSVAPFDAEVKCGESDLTPDGYIALGPSITFGPADKVFNREVPVSIPINPVLMPQAARQRHVRLMYSGPAFSKPRTIPVADPRIEKVDGQWAVTFKAPRLGTYQAVVAKDAGTKTRKRKLTHRAVIGVSMGGAGTAMFGLRHHDLFDVIAPLGGPVDWTWLLHYIENNHLGGFRSIPPGTTLGDLTLEATSCASAADCKPDETCVGALGLPPGKCVLMPTPKDPYEHAQTFNTWWYEYPREGNGGSFPRSEYAQIFRDLALMFGNPNGENLTPGGENLPAGVHPDDPSQVGDHANGECKVWVDPLDGPDKEKQEAIADSCPAERCSHTLSLANYYDDEYNPDGTFPVITICDGSPQNQALTPYANSWAPGSNNYPLEVGLAVDYNANGVRDELEPVIRAGHERWFDHGVDGVPSSAEPGYMKGVNDDPAGDDYNAQYNPAGTEGDMRRQPEEMFEDTGLDGVMGTKQQPAGGYTKPGDGYDVGEGDGKFTVASGLQRFWDYDPHSIVRKMTSTVPGGELTDEALSRIDLWTDGGTRDLFNFHVDAQHLAGTFAARGRDVAYFTGFTELPGLDPETPNDFSPPKVIYEDLQGIVFQRYGKIDPAPVDIQNGSGQHVGKASEVVTRLQSALYFIGSRWQEPELRELVEDTKTDPREGVTECEELGSCSMMFTSSFGRTGPVAISLPPGYGNAKQQDRRYPVIYMLHGYGQTPEDLSAAVILLQNWMNNSLESAENRLPKAILVYVDGRCRVGANGKPECIRGTFFTDSAREDGVQNEQWWLELMDYVDQNYRTMGESVVDWTD
ncbi:MAG: hypothetical protein HUU21_25275 [Polyangiaceae bacterium]|nr:hypothetical protein [Polyangiaceae bacterium]